MSEFEKKLEAWDSKIPGNPQNEPNPIERKFVAEIRINCETIEIPVYYIAPPDNYCVEDHDITLEVPGIEPDNEYVTIDGLLGYIKMSIIKQTNDDNESHKSEGPDYDDL